MEKPVVRIKNWTISYDEWRGGYVLRGATIGHYRLGNCEAVTTSRIVAFHKEIKKVETLNTMYQLVGPGKCLVKETAEEGK